MFKETKYSFAMANAKDEAKKEAYAITKSVSEHGVYCVLKDLC